MFHCSCESFHEKIKKQFLEQYNKEINTGGLFRFVADVFVSDAICFLSTFTYPILRAFFENRAIK